MTTRMRTRLRRVLLAVGVMAAPAALHAQANALARGTAALRAGRYDEAISTLSGVAAPSARRLHVRALLEVGREVEADAAARRYAADPTSGDALQGTLGDVRAHR